MLKKFLIFSLLLFSSAFGREISAPVFWPSSSHVNSAGLKTLVKPDKGLSLYGPFNMHSSFARDYHFTSNTPVIGDNSIFILGPKGNLYSYKLRDPSALNWHINFGENNASEISDGGGMYLKGSHLAVTYGSNEIVLLESKTGKILWRFELTSISKSAPYILGKNVYVKTVDNKVYCFNLEKGEVNWIYEGIPENINILRSASIVSYKDMVIVPCSAEQILFLKADSGELSLNLSLEQNQYSPVSKKVYAFQIHKTTAFISLTQGFLYAFDLETGAMKWQRDDILEGNVPWIDSSDLYVINNDAVLMKLSASDGKTQWHKALQQGRGQLTSPVVFDKKIFIASSNGVLSSFTLFKGGSIRDYKVVPSVFAPLAPTTIGMFMLTKNGRLLFLS